MAWQPISTAPKDGTYVVLLRTDDQGFCYPWSDDGHAIGFWDSDEGGGLGGWFASEASSGSLLNGGDPGPTHWMLLPLPPKTADQ